MNKELEPGTTVSHYRIVSKIGAGGMGEVYLADDTKLERQVALKILLPEVAGDDERVRRFIQEAKAASALNHPNILTVFEIGTFEGLRYIATEFIKGDTLRDKMKVEKRKLGDALEITLQVAAALGAAHEAGIIHRDIKPENIMIREDNLVKVLDFGLAKLTDAPAASVDTTLPQLNTHPGTLVGTVAYMSPEQARGRKLDPRSDIFSLGIVMFELFTGKRPFDGEGHLDLISSILKDEAPSLRQVSPDLPRQLERIVDKTLRKDRDHRYQHVRDLHIDIEDLRDELKFEAKLNQSVQPTLAGSALPTLPSELRSAFTTGLSKTRRFTLLHAFIFLIAVAGVVGASWYFRLIGSGAPNIVPGSYKVNEFANWNSAPGELFSNASFSPDGKLIAFSSTKSGTKNLWVTQTGSSEAIQITNDSFANIDPIWSPKGDEIAFFSERPSSAGGKATYGIWRVSALGGSARSVGTLSDGAASLRRWLPSGKVFYELRGNLYALDISNGVSQKVTQFEKTDIRWMDISPDEKTIAYATLSKDAWKLMTSDISGEKAKEIASGTGMIEGVAWLPEKNRLFYSATYNGVVQVFLTEVGSLRSDRITASETDNSVVDAAPDGKSIIFSSAKEESNLWRINISDGQESPISRDLNAKLWPSVSADNEKIAFQSVKNLSSGNKLFEMAIVAKSLKASGEGERTTQLAERGFAPAWSPDSSTLAFLRKNDGSTELFTVNPDGGGEKRLNAGSIPIVGYTVSPYNYVQAKAFAWSPDGTRIAYVSDTNGIVNIWAVSVRDGTAAALTNSSDANFTFSCPIWSSDGKRIAFSFQKKGDNGGKAVRGLKFLDLATGVTSDVYESERIMRFLGWTADEAGLIVAEAEKQGGLPPETVLKKVAISGGAELEIVRLKNAYFYNILLSEDRKLISYVAREQNMDDIWVIPSASGKARKLTSNNDSGLSYSRLNWFPDGSAITFGKQTRFSLLSMMNDID